MSLLRSSGSDNDASPSPTPPVSGVVGEGTAAKYDLSSSEGSGSGDEDVEQGIWSGGVND